MNARRLLSLVPLLPVLPILGSVAGCEWHVVDDHGGTPSASTAGAHGAPPGAPGEPSASASSGASCGVAVDRWKELLVINRSVLSDRRASNDVPDAPWSFRTRMEELAGSSAQAPALVQGWLAEWSTRTSVGEHAAPVTPRNTADTVLTGAWPFRLVAIVNRLDLREGQAGCDGAAGELRFVYTAIDAKTRLAIPFSVIVELPYPASRSPREWAQRWHDVAAQPFGADYNEALASLTAEITSKATRTATRVRTNEIALGEPLGLPWEMREFALAADDASSPRRLVQAPLLATPRIELARSPSLDAWMQDNAAKVLAGSHVLPGGMQAGAAPMTSPFFRWPSSTVSEDLRRALSVGTCNGCHGGERPADTLRFQHLAPGDTTAGYYPATNGETQVSRHLHDPSGGDDELGRRSRSVALMLCATCTTGSPPSPPSPSYEP